MPWVSGRRWGRQRLQHGRLDIYCSATTNRFLNLFIFGQATETIFFFQLDQSSRAADCKVCPRLCASAQGRHFLRRHGLWTFASDYEGVGHVRHMMCPYFDFHNMRWDMTPVLWTNQNVLWTQTFWYCLITPATYKPLCCVLLLPDSWMCLEDIFSFLSSADLEYKSFDQA